MNRYDIYARFADRHLSTPAEQAIYRVLVSQQARLWSPADLAVQAGLSPHEVQQILARYVPAGVVEEVTTGEGRRYRWRSDMDYLFGAGPDGEPWVDPVCDMPVTPDSPYQADDAAGRTWRFCSSVCVTVFTRVS